jgi:hypothetical protein
MMLYQPSAVDVVVIAFMLTDVVDADDDAIPAPCCE